MLLLVLLSVLSDHVEAQILPPYGSEFHEDFELDGPELTLEHATAAVDVISQHAGPYSSLTAEVVSCDPLPAGQPCVPGATFGVSLDFEYGIEAGNPSVGYFDLCIEFSEIQADCTVKRWQVCVEWDDVPYFNVYEFHVLLHTPLPPTTEPAASGFQGAETSLDGECVVVRIVAWGGVVYSGAQFLATADPSMLAAAMEAIATARDLNPEETCFHWTAP